MYNIMKNVIKSKDYELADIITKLNKVWIQNKISEEQKEELLALARECATPENSHAALSEQIKLAFDKIAELKAVVEELKAKIEPEETPDEEPSDPNEPEVETPVVYPEYKQPLGAHDAYHAGDIVTYKDEIYTCIAPEGVAVVWAPDVYPAYWELVKPDEEAEEAETNE